MDGCRFCTNCSILANASAYLRYAWCLDPANRREPEPPRPVPRHELEEFFDLCDDIS